MKSSSLNILERSLSSLDMNTRVKVRSIFLVPTSSERRGAVRRVMRQDLLRHCDEVCSRMYAMQVSKNTKERRPPFSMPICDLCCNEGHIEEDCVYLDSLIKQAKFLRKGTR